MHFVCRLGPAFVSTYCVPCSLQLFAIVLFILQFYYYFSSLFLLSSCTYFLEESTVLARTEIKSAAPRQRV